MRKDDEIFVDDDEILKIYLYNIFLIYCLWFCYGKIVIIFENL